MRLKFNLLNFDKNKEVSEFLDLHRSNWFAPQILGPTRFVEQYQPSLAENIFINFSNIHRKSGNIIKNPFTKLFNINPKTAGRGGVNLTPAPLWLFKNCIF